jgi:hypothetical protein
LHEIKALPSEWIISPRYGEKVLNLVDRTYLSPNAQGRGELNFDRWSWSAFLLRREVKFGDQAKCGKKMTSDLSRSTASSDGS